MRKNYLVLFAMLFAVSTAFGQIAKSGLDDAYLKMSEKEKAEIVKKQSDQPIQQTHIHSPFASKEATDCPESSLFGNPLVDFENASTAEGAAGFKIAQSFYVDGSIESITFWGISAYFDGSAWGACTGADPETFDLVFHEMDGQDIGEVHQTNTDLEATAVGTGIMFADAYEVIQYTLVLPTPITDLPGGFASISGKTDNSCWFLWVDAPTGNGFAYQYSDEDGVWGMMDVPVTICVSGEMSSCPAPVDLAVSNVTLEQADLGWTELGSATTWMVEFSEMVNDQVSSTVFETNLNPYTQGGLVGNNEYTYTVQSVCGVGDTSNWSMPLTFATPCDVVTSYPYMEDFDGDWETFCWNVIDADADGTTWTQGNTYISPTHSGEYAAHGMGNADDWLISPEFNLDGEYQVSWWDKVESENYNNTYEIWVSTTGMAVEDFTDKVAEINCINTDWEQHAVYLNAYAGETVYIGIHQTYSGSSYYGFGIDDFEVSVAPTCPPVSMIMVDNITKTTADVAWIENGAATAWNIEYGMAGFTQGEGTVMAVTENPYTLIDLTEGTAYEVYVQADCGGETSAWAGPVMFNTSCDVLVDINEGFEEAVPPICWSNFANGAGNKIWIQSDAVVNSGMYAAKASYQSSGGTNEQWLVTGKVTVPTGKALSFFTADDFGTDYGSMLEVKVSADADPMNTEAYVDLITIYEADVVNDVMSPVSIDVAAYEGQDVFFAFVMIDDDGDNWYVDDVAFISCGAPTGLGVNDVTETTATLVWESSAANFMVEYGEDGFTLGNGTSAEVAETSLAIDGLMENTIYNFYVKALCAEDDESTWAGPFVFQTLAAPCDDITEFPYNHGFEGLDDFDCWTPLYNTAADGGLDGNNLVVAPTENTWFVLDPTGFSGNGAYYIFEGERAAAIGYSAPDFNWLVSPGIDLTEVSDAELGFMLWIKDSVEANWISKFYVTVFDGTTWTTEKTWNADTPSNLYDSEEVVDLSAYAGSVINVAFVFEYNDGYELAIDNIELRTAPPAETVNVTFNVDMTTHEEFDAANDTVWITGNFAGWAEPGSEGSFFLTDEDADMVYTLTVEVDENYGELLYKYFDGPSWDNGEWTGDPNRSVMIATEDVVVNNVWGVISVEANKLAAVSLYPNPANDLVWIEGEFMNEISVNIMDISGKVHMNTISNKSKVAIDLSEFENGLYFIEIISGTEKAIFRVVKQ